MQRGDAILCRARTRFGTLCQNIVVKGKKRCRMHGGASGSGAPRGNKNAFKHGKYSMDTIKTVKKVNQMVEAWTRLCQKMEDHEG
jgi:hypothetical protein